MKWVASKFSDILLALKRLFKHSNTIFISFLKSQGFELVNTKVVSSANKIGSDFRLIITDKSFIWCRKSKGPKMQTTLSFVYFIRFSVLKFRFNISHVDFIWNYDLGNSTKIFSNIETIANKCVSQGENWDKWTDMAFLRLLQI
jgi:hypothetical protein